MALGDAMMTAGMAENRLAAERLAIDRTMALLKRERINKRRRLNRMNRRADALRAQADKLASDLYGKRRYFVVGTIGSVIGEVYAVDDAEAMRAAVDWIGERHVQSIHDMTPEPRKRKR